MEAFETLQLGGIAVYPLLALGVIMTVITLDKAIVHTRHGRLPPRLLALVETFDFDWKTFQQNVAGMRNGNFYRRFFSVIYEHRDKPVWWVESRAGDEAHLIEKELNRGQWVLDTVVTAAPLIG